jgi:hypothetical protein
MFGTAICGRTVQYPIRGSMAAIRGIGGVVRFLIFSLAGGHENYGHHEMFGGIFMILAVRR